MQSCSPCKCGKGNRLYRTWSGATAYLKKVDGLGEKGRRMREAGGGRREAGGGRREAGGGKREAGSGKREAGGGRRECKKVPRAGVATHLTSLALFFLFRIPHPASRYSPIATSFASNPYRAGSLAMRAAAIIIGT